MAFLCAVLLLSLPSISSARPSTASSSNLGTANDYNVFVFGNGTLETGGSTIEGRLAVGGLVKTKNYSVAPNVPSSDAQVPYNIVFGGAGNTTATTFSGTFYGSLVSNATTTTISVPDVRSGNGVSGSGNVHAIKALDLGGNNGWGGTVQGNALYGTTFRKDANVTINGQTQQNTTNALPFSFAAAESDLRNLSTRLKALTATGTTTVQYGGITLNGTVTGLNVFNVTVASLNSCNSFTVNVPAGATVLINVTGSGSPAMQNFGITINGTDSGKVLWHFPDATSVGFGTSGGIEVKGSVLAPNAAVNFGNGQIGGTLVCKSLTATGLFKHVPFTGNLDGAPATATLLSLSVSPASVIGGQANATGTVTLSSAAPAGGAVIAVSSNSSVAGTPVNVTVAAGQTTATFPIVTNEVTMSTPVTISASYGGVGKSAPLTVNPPPVPTVLSFVVSPTNVLGGNNASAVVTLSAPAPAGGAVISLSSANTGVATVPASVTIPAGATQSAAVVVATVPVAASTNVVLTASYSGSSKTATLTVTPPSLVSVSVAPASVKGGKDNATGTVTLSSNAPTGGLVVSLSSSATGAATTPANVTVAAGSTTATFTVTSKSVASDTDVTISATLAGVTKTASLQVLAPALVSLSVTPTSVVGGNESQGKATIDAPSPAGGLTVSLSSSSNKATVPTSINIPAGAMESNSFAVTTVAVATEITASITGTLNGTSKAATLTITAPKLLAISFNPTSIRGANPSTGTVTIDSPAPDGFTVSLSSESGTVVVPTSVTIPVGTLSATFTATTQMVTVETPVVVTASHDAEMKTATLTLLPTPDDFLVLTVVSVKPSAPDTVVGGDMALGTVTIAEPAPTGGAVIALSTDLSAKITVPETVTIPAGQTTVTVDILTKAVPQDVPFHVTASWQGVSKSVALTLLAPKVKSLAFLPNSVKGGMLSVGTVELTSIAPEEGITVAVVSANPSVATPAVTELVFAAGETIKAFDVTTSVVAADTIVPFTATLNNLVTQETLTVTSPKVTLSSFVVAPNPVTGGEEATATATLAEPAPAGGVTITITSSSDKVTVTPATLTIAEGTLTGSVSVKTVPVSTDTSAVLTATFPGSPSQTATLTVLAPVLDSVSLNPTTVLGGKPTTGTVTISGKAPAGGITVSLSSSDPAKAKLSTPARAQIPEGETSGVFLVQTVPVATEVTTTITGTLNGTSKSATLTIRPPTLLSVTVNPTSVKSGLGSTGTVTVSGPSPASGLVVELASDKPSVTLPSSVNIAAGAKTATFAIATGSITSTQVATITGTLNATSQSAKLTVIPASATADGNLFLSLVITPKSVLGGGVAIAEVSLVSATDGTAVAAPAGGATITLVSDQPETVVSGLPPQVVIPAGESKIAFVLTGGTVAESTTATITATYAEASATDTLTVSPEPCGGTGTVTVATLSFAPGSATGGVGKVIGTVSLSAPAATGGTLIRLFTTNPANETLVSFPRYVWVRGGEDTVTFSVTTKPVLASTTIAFQAQANATNATGSLTLLPTLETSPTGGGSGVPDGPALTPAAIARGFRMTTFLSGYPKTGPSSAWIVSLPSGKVLFRPRAVSPSGIRIYPNEDYQTVESAEQVLTLTGTDDGVQFIRSGTSLFSVKSQGPVLEWNEENWTVKRTLVPQFGLRSDSNFKPDLDPRTGKMLFNVYRMDLASGSLERYFYIWYHAFGEVWGDGVGGGRGLAVSEDGSRFYYSSGEGLVAYSPDQYYRPTGAPETLRNNVVLGRIGGYSHSRIGTGTLSGYLYAESNFLGTSSIVQKNIATGEEIVLVTFQDENRGLCYDEAGNLWVCFSDRVMRLYPPTGGYFGVQYPEAIYTRDDVTATSHAPLTLSAPSNLEGAVSTNAGFDLSAIAGRVSGARVLRAGKLSSSTGAARFDAQLGVHSGLTSLTTVDPLQSWSDNAYASLEQKSLPFSYGEEWELPAALQLEIQRQGLSGSSSLYPLKLVTRVTGVCGDPLLTDTANTGWPHRKNTLTLRVAPLGIPKVSPGRSLDITLPRKTVVLATAGATWEIYRDQVLVATSVAATGWDVEDDHTFYKGVHVTVPAGTVPGAYEVRSTGVAQGASNFLVTTVDEGTAAVLKPLVLSSKAVTGGSSSILTVTLDAPAPTGGATVALWTTGSLSPLSMPDRVVINAGATTGTATIATVPGAATFHIHASYNGYRVTRLDVDGGAEPPADVTLTGFTVLPGSVTGGISATGTVTLSRVAPEGGVRIAIAASDAMNVPVASSVLVPEGFASISFGIPTRAVGQTTPVTLTATYGAVSLNAPLTLLPQGIPPTVKITNPQEGETFSTAQGQTTVDVPITVEAKSNTAGVALSQVEVFADGTKIGDATGTGDSYNLTWTGATIGTHKLTAKATDAQGRTANSAPVNITVTDKPTVQTPVISPPGGVYDRSFVSVSITCATAGATIRYTVDGSDPASSRTAQTYRSPFIVRGGGATVKARAFKTGIETSNLASATYYLDVDTGGGGAGGPLTVRITAPGDGGTVTQPTEVTGEVTAPVLDGVSTAWELSVRLAGSNNEWQTLENGVIVGGTNIAVSGKFDPTLRLNGAYNLRLIAQTSDGRYAEDLVSVIVEGNMKLGNFKLSHEDLTIPVAGIPITITRSYDTLAKDTENDFGRGWSLQIASIRLQKSVPVHDFWEQKGVFISEFLGSQYQFQQSKKHFITITFPNGQVMKFAADYKPKFQYIYPIQNARLDWVAIGDTRGSLKPVDGSDTDISKNNVFVVPGDGDGFDYGDAWRANYLMGYDDLVYNPDLWELRTLDGMVMHISESRGLVYVREPNGNTLTFDRSGIHSSTGLGVDFTRDGQDRITAIRDPKGSFLRYTIDGNGDLAKFTDRMGNSTTYTYNGFHALLNILDPNGRLLSSNDYDPNTERATATHDEKGNTVEFTHGIDDPDVPDSIEIVRDELGFRTTVGFDSRGNVIQESRTLVLPDGTQQIIANSTSYGDSRFPDLPTKVTDELGHSTTYTYGANGELLETRDPLGNIVATVTYNSQGKPITVSDVDGRIIIVNEFDAGGKLLKSTDALGRSQRFEYNPNGTLARLFDVFGNVSTMSYDPQGRGWVMGATDALGNSIALTRDLNGNITSKTSEWTVYDPANTGLRSVGSLLGAKRTNARVGATLDTGGTEQSDEIPECKPDPDASGGGLVLARATTDYAYDFTDRVVKRMFPGGKEALVNFDNRGNILEIQDVAGRISQYTYDDKGRQLGTLFPDGTTATSQYDIKGRKTRGTDRGNRAVEYEWDPLDRMTKVTLLNAGGTVEAQESYDYDVKSRLIGIRDYFARLTRIDYDEMDRVKKVTAPTGEFLEYIYDNRKNILRAMRDNKGNEVRYDYDEMYQLTNVQTPDGKETRYEYDEKGRVKAFHSPSGATYTYRYDSLDQMTSVTDPAGRKWTFAYDELGNRICRKDANGNLTRFIYDQAIPGQLIARVMPLGQREDYTYTIDGELKTVTDDNGFTTSYNYDSLTGYLKSIQPDARKSEPGVTFDYSTDGLLRRATRGGVINEFGYDGLGRLTRDGDTTYGYDKVGNLTFEQTPTGRTSYEYDAGNRLKKTIGADGLATVYTYDELSRLDTMTRPNGVVTTYQYDNMGRVTQMTHAGNGFAIPYLQTYDDDGRLLTYTDETGTTTYRYDITGRLEQESSPRAVTTYSYDNVGNRLTKTVVGTGMSNSFVYTYDINDRMTQVAGPNGTTTYEYDDNGNCIRAGSVTLRYDAFDRMVTANLPTGAVTYTYDAQGNRIAQTTSEGTTQYLVNGGDVVEERDPAGVVTRYEMDGSRLRSIRGGQSAWFLEDAGGGTAALASGTGTMTDRYVYDSFGMPVRVSGNSDNAFLGIGGEQYDAATGLYYLRARYYDPQAGRFLGSDPLDGDDANPATLNKYAYAGSDPINNFDPSGESFTLGETNFSMSLSGQFRMSFWEGIGYGQMVDSIGGMDLKQFGSLKFYKKLANDTVKQIAADGWIWSVAKVAGNVNPLIGSIIGLLQNAYQTSQSLEQSHRILMDPNASAEEKQMAGYTAMFSVAEFGFNAVQVSASASQGFLAKHGGPGRMGDAIGEMEHVVPHGPGKSAFFTSRESRLRTGGLKGQSVENRWIKMPEGCAIGFSFLPDTPVVAGEALEGNLSNLPDAGDVFGTGKHIKTISELRVGDPVVARNADTGKTEWKRVTAVHSRTTYEVVYLYLADSSGKIVETLGTTAEHPFMTPTGWVDTGSLGIGTEIVTRAGPNLVVAKVERVAKPEGVTVYNLTVDGDHTYFVGLTSGGVLSHNIACGSYGSPDNVGGHHIHAQAAFNGDPNYNRYRALAISDAELLTYGVDHRGPFPSVTSQQRALFDELADDIANNRKDASAASSWREHNRIAYEALVGAGLDPLEASQAVRDSLRQLKAIGASPQRIPWH